MCNFLFTGALRSMGIILLEVMEKFNCGAAVTGFMFGVSCGVMSISCKIFVPVCFIFNMRHSFYEQ